MTTLRRYRQAVAAVLIAAMALVQLPAGAAVAAEGGPIATQDAVGAQADKGLTVAAKRAAVTDFLDRDAVAQKLAAYGVDPAEAKARVAGLSDAEVARLYDKVEHAPAGGVVGELVGAAVFVFIVLLVTDILGFTNVFPFTQSVDR